MCVCVCVCVYVRVCVHICVCALGDGVQVYTVYIEMHTHITTSSLCMDVCARIYVCVCVMVRVYLWSHWALHCPQTVPGWPMILMATFTAPQASPHVTPGNRSVLQHDTQVVY